jgi:hypothetical protein
MVKKMNFLFLLLFFISCEKEGAFTKSPSQSVINPNDGFVTLYMGTFYPTSGITVSGSASIYEKDSQKYVALNDFSISSGPDLKVYLSTTASPDTFVNLGNLTSAMIYAIPSQVDVSVYKYVLIHCQQYNHLFAIAELN